jgi:ferrochelatase
MDDVRELEEGVRKTSGYDALLLISFGGPEGPGEVMPFLDRVLRGRPASTRRAEVAHHYERFGGVSPINGHCRALLEALRGELAAHGPRLPVYWGNRNWHPLLADTLRGMARDGVRRALAFATSAYSSFPSCRVYLVDLEAARAEVGPGAPRVDKLRPFFDHPGFVTANAERLRDALAGIAPARRAAARVAFTAHSIPLAMAAASDYVAQLEETCRLVAAAAGGPPWALVYQSRSAPPPAAWLEPDIRDHLAALRTEGVEAVVAAPIGFVMDHMEVVYDLDVEAREVARGLGLEFVRAATAGTHPAFVSMIRELVLEQVAGAPRRALGRRGPRPDRCPADCCPAAPAPPAAAVTPA